MRDESALRKRVREAIQAGKLLGNRPQRTWAGRGCGVYCTICAEPVKPDQVEFELEFAQSNGHASPGNYHVHLRCFEAWEFELENLELTAGTICSSGQMHSATLALQGAGNDGTIAACDCDPTCRRGPV